MLSALAFIVISATVPHVESAGTVVARLGSELGQRVEVARDLAGAPVLVDDEDLPPEATLQALAFALHGSLARDGETVRLDVLPPIAASFKRRTSRRTAP